MSNYENWWKFLVQELEKNQIDDQELLNELEKLRNSFAHNQSSFVYHELGHLEFFKNNSKEDWKIYLRDINNLNKALSRNDKKTYGVAHYKENGTVKVKIKIPPSFPSTDQTSGKFFNSLLYLLPKKFREEYVGDLLEDRENLKKRGLPKWKINLIAFGNILCLLITSRWIWFQGLFQSAFKYFKEFIQ